MGLGRKGASTVRFWSASTADTVYPDLAPARFATAEVPTIGKDPDNLGPTASAPPAVLPMPATWSFRCGLYCRCSRACQYCHPSCACQRLWLAGTSFVRWCRPRLWLRPRFPSDGPRRRVGGRSALRVMTSPRQMLPLPHVSPLRTTASTTVTSPRGMRTQAGVPIISGLVLVLGLLDKKIGP